MQILFNIIIGSGGLVGVFLISFWLWYQFAKQELAYRKKHPELAGQPVKFDKWVHHPYEWLIEKLSNGLPNALWPDTVEKNSKPDGFWARLEWAISFYAADDAHVARLASTPWSWPLMDLALRIAIAYPVLFAALVWALGGDGTLGGYPFFPADPPIWVKPVTLALIALAAFTALANLAALQGVFEKLATWLNTLTVCVAVAVVVAAASAGAVAGVSAVAVAVAGASAVAFAGAVTVAFAGASAGAFAVAGAVVFAGAGEVVFAGAGAAAVAAAVAVTGAVAFFARKKLRFGADWVDPGILAYLAVIAAGLSAGLLALPFYPDGTQVIVVFLLLLPLTNAVFDWVSYGTTLKLLEYGWSQRNMPGRRYWVWLTGVIDAAIALVLFFVLSIAIFAVLFAANSVTGVQLFDLAALLAQIEDNHWEVIWLIAMIGSTLVPTLVHLGFAAFGLMTLAPTKRWSHYIEVQDGGPGDTVFYKVWFPLQAACFTALAATLPIGFGALLWFHGGHLVDGYARAIYAITDYLGLLNVPSDWELRPAIDL